MFRKSILCVFLSAASTVLLFGTETKKVEIDINLLNKAYAELYISDRSPVNWINFNTGKQIRDMGRRLGDEIRYQEQVNKAVIPYAGGTPDLKYKAVRVYSGNKAGGDVLFISRKAKVNTIQNIERIVSGYIEKAYGISMDDADKIAKKVCYWNTNHYNDTAYFTENFQVRIREVFANNTSVLGLARSYKNWLGKTRIIIPFILIQQQVPKISEPSFSPDVSTGIVETQSKKTPDTMVVPEEPAPVKSSNNGLFDTSIAKRKSSVAPVSIILIILLCCLVIILCICIVKIFYDKRHMDIYSVINLQ